jgi:hypothetical protein
MTISSPEKTANVSRTESSEPVSHGSFSDFQALKESLIALLEFGSQSGRPMMSIKIIPNAENPKEAHKHVKFKITLPKADGSIEQHVFKWATNLPTDKINEFIIQNIQDLSPYLFDPEGEEGEMLVVEEVK